MAVVEAADFLIIVCKFDSCVILKKNTLQRYDIFLMCKYRKNSILCIFIKIMYFIFTFKSIRRRAVKKVRYCLFLQIFFYNFVKRVY